ncbi:putative Cytoplasmic 60S subunit biogenesis factor [Blattamonas nauphoetae]|uniref:Cytoplasmic 60S subunit biogenesis factor n=1 Tax=Blattamonas nauphoetae TaxID=2049346 RepID=A0ABQ9YCA1_9EUKA|nr:putative Cytoplasmic 60S subunit biogenesis factor [Blattamonas nauphoetae]
MATPSFTCLTCHIRFPDSASQKSHFSTPWHRENLRRKVAGDGPLSPEEFDAVSEVKPVQDLLELKNCSICSKEYSSHKALVQHCKSKNHIYKAEVKEMDPTLGIPELQSYTILDTSEKRPKKQEKPSKSSPTEIEAEPSKEEPENEQEEEEDEFEFEFDPGKCLFCNKQSKDLQKNILHMVESHSFVIDEIEYVVDIQGLIDYLSDSIFVDHRCIACARQFPSSEAVQHHMCAKSHCYFVYDSGKDEHDGDDSDDEDDDNYLFLFYDFSSTYPTEQPDDADQPIPHDILKQTRKIIKALGEDAIAVEDQLGINPVPRAGPSKEGDDSSTRPVGVTEFDELVLSDGTQIGNRTLMKFYRKGPERRRVTNDIIVRQLMKQYQKDAVLRAKQETIKQDSQATQDFEQHKTKSMKSKRSAPGPYSSRPTGARDSLEDREDKDQKRIQLAREILNQIDTRSHELDVGQSERDILDPDAKRRVLQTSNICFQPTEQIEPKMKISFKTVPTCVSLDQRHQFAAVGSKSGGFHICDIETGKHTLFSGRNKRASSSSGHFKPIVSCCVAELPKSSSPIVITGSEDRTIRIWDLRGSQEVAVLSGHRGAVTSLVMAGGNIPAHSNFQIDDQEGLANCLVSCSDDATLKTWNMEMMTYIDTSYGHTSSITAIDSLTTSTCVTVSSDLTLRKWKIFDASQTVHSFSSTEPPHFSIDSVALLNQHIAVSGTSDGTLSLWTLNKKTPRLSIPNAQQATSNDLRGILSVATLRFSTLFATGGLSERIQLWRVRDAKCEEVERRGTIPTRGIVNGMALWDQMGDWSEAEMELYESTATHAQRRKERESDDSEDERVRRRKGGKKPKKEADSESDGDESADESEQSFDLDESDESEEESEEDDRSLLNRRMLVAAVTGREERNGRWNTCRAGKNAFVVYSLPFYNE